MHPPWSLVVILIYTAYLYEIKMTITIPHCHILQNIRGTHYKKHLLILSEAMNKTDT